MTCLTCFAPTDGLERVAVTDLGSSHGLTDQTAKAYERFYGLKTVLRSSSDFPELMSAALGAAAAVLSREDRTGSTGTVVYCKTQTHNTPAESHWLQTLVAGAGLARWQCFTLSMTNCASLLAAVHWIAQDGGMAAAESGPVILIAGEKAFHPSFSRLSVGLLSERPVAVVIRSEVGDWRIKGSFVRHDPQFYVNPDDMAPDDKRVLNDEFLDRFCGFLDAAVSSAPAFSDAPYTVVPYNLNRPLLRRIATKLGWDDRLRLGNIVADGHMFCSDIPANLTELPLPSGEENRTRVFAFAAGMGITFAGLFLESTSGSQLQEGE